MVEFWLYFFFTGCNREAGHKIRFPPWFYFNLRYFIYLFIFIQKKHIVNCIPEAVWTRADLYICRIKKPTPRDDAQGGEELVAGNSAGKDTGRASTRRSKFLRVGLTRRLWSGACERVRRFLTGGFRLLAPPTVADLPLVRFWWWRTCNDCNN